MSFRSVRIGLVCGVLALLSMVLSTPTLAASLTLDPPTLKIDPGKVFDVAIILDTQGTSSSVTDVSLSFDPQRLEVIAILDGTMYPHTMGKFIDNASGKAEVSGTIDLSSTPQYVTGRGTFATLQVLAKTSGATTITFNYRKGSINDSNNVIDGTIPIVINPDGSIVSPTDLTTLDKLTFVGSSSIAVTGLSSGVTPGGTIVPQCDRCGKCLNDTVDPPGYAECIVCTYDNPGPPPAVPKDGYQWTIAGCIETSSAATTQQVYQIVIAVSGGVLFLVFLTGGFLLLTSQGNPDKIYRAKQLITGSIIALILVLFGVLVYRFIGSEILKIPGFS